MDKFNILECTLRDGGYITDWHFEKKMMTDIVKNLIDANLDFVEVGYLNHKSYEENTSQFYNIEQISEILPYKRKNTIILAMADVQQFLPEDLTPFSGKSIDGIRVVFYKHQIEEALKMCEAVSKCGYKLFVQPMVTIDYTVDEYAALIARIKGLNPCAVSIVDSFGYMIKSDFRNYFKILDNLLPSETIIGFHSHNNMNLAFITAQDILEYQTTRNIIIDSSLYGMGRGAGNLNTELICNYYNKLLGEKYSMNKILSLISDYIMPINQKRKWGYSPYMFITGLYHYHPNFACYLLDEYEVSVSEFQKFLLTIPEDMKAKCKKPYVLKMYKKFKENGELFKTFNIEDGMAITLMKKASLIPVVLTGRFSKITEIRCNDLGIIELHQGVTDKLSVLQSILKCYGIKANAALYFGDDVNDIDCMKYCGFSACPSDSADEVKKNCNLYLQKNGGEGALRELLESFIKC